MSSTTRTQISELGKVAFTQRVLAPFSDQKLNPWADDAAIIDRGEYYELVATDTMLEGIDFDLQYTPLEYLGQKVVVAAISNILAMNGQAEYITLSLGISARFSVEELEQLFAGLRAATKHQNIELITGNISASLTGLTIATTTIGRVQKESITKRDGAKPTDLICLSGNLGAAILGLHLLEREKRATNGTSTISPEIAKKYSYLLQRQLKPETRKDIITKLKELAITPSSMIDITQGLASAALHLCQSSQVGARIYLERLPIASEVFEAAEEFKIDPVVAALNGGDDFELLFTVPLDMHKEMLTMPGVDVIGHIVEQEKGAALTTPDGAEISLQAQDWTAQE